MDDEGPDTVLATLTAACMSRAEALVLLGATVDARHARIVRVDAAAGQIALELLSEVTEAELDTVSLCTVSLQHGSELKVFAAPFVEYVVNDANTGQGVLVVELPTEVASSEGRRNFRVPIDEDLDLRIQVWYGTPGRRLNCKAVDLSGSGVQIEVAPSCGVRLHVGERCEVRMSTGEHAARLSAEVRAADDRRFGLLFPDAVRHTGLEPNNDFMAILRDAEAAWIRGRGSR